MTIADKDIAAAVAQSAAWYEEAHTKYGLLARISLPANAEQARKSLVTERKNILDRMFFRRWRFADGWLTSMDATKALEIFHDPLAQAMRRAVVRRLYPAFPQMAEDFFG